MAVKRKRVNSVGPAFQTRIVNPIKGRTKTLQVLAQRHHHYLDSGFHEDLNINYAVSPSDDWQRLRKYSSFAIQPSDKSLQSVKFSSNDIIIVANSDLVRMNGVSVENITQSWVARVVEIRAKDKAHVYVLVQWLYWPNELPSGRQLYHSKYELVGSNHLDVIEATTVSCKWPVTAWAEDEDDYVLSNGDDSSSSQVRGLYGLFWRQTYNVYNHKLSTLRKYCLCQQYHNPDHPLIKCENPTCDLWLHGKCIIRCAIDQKHTEMLESDNDYRKRTDKIDGKGWGKLLYGNLISSSDQGPRQKFHTTIRDLRLHDKDFTADSNEQGFWHEQARCPNCDSLIP